MKFLIASLLLANMAPASGFDIPPTCAMVYDDPHFLTFDQMTSDCQGTGDFIVAKTLDEDSDFEVQARFTAGSESGQQSWQESKGLDLGTVTKAFVVTTGAAGEPRIEVDADVAANNGECKLNYYVDGVLTQFGANDRAGSAIYFQRRHAWARRGNQHFKVNYRNLIFVKSGVFVQVYKKYHTWFGCYLNYKICVPDSIKDSQLVGILGNADGNNSNEFMDREGTLITPAPNTIGEKNAYCEANWCIGHEDNSHFKESDINGVCKTRHDDALEEAVRKASEEIKEACEQDPDCIEDTVVTGDPSVGKRTLEDKKEMKEEKVEVDPEPEDEHEDDICRTAEGLDVPCDAFDGNIKCEEMEGYDFGYKMDGCDSNGDGVFNHLGMELVDQDKTCAIGDVGSFDITCAVPDGNQWKDAIITPTVDAVVKVKGGNGGTLYTDVKAGETYTLRTGSGSRYKAISHIEFCFKCPERVVDNEVVTCSADVLACDDGTTLSRDPENECAFPECPVQDDVPDTTSTPGTMGDPHFKTHGGEMYDFHGGCDLVLLDNPDFQDGLGMKIHIRTKVETWWSYVQSAVVQIGEETVEINGDNAENWLYTNGLPALHDEQEWKFGTIAGLVLRSKAMGGGGHEAHIQLGNGEKITLKTYNRFVKVELYNAGKDLYNGSQGLLGRFPDGERVGRDGETPINDVNDFGQEWQVQSAEPKLFHTYDDAWVVPAGQTCTMPDSSAAKQKLRQRRLADGIPTEEAEKACAHLSSEDDRTACVFDIIATQDVNMAAVW